MPADAAARTDLVAARLFVAVWPPPGVVATLAALPRPVVPGVRWTTPDQWHVTLRFLGDAEPGPALDALVAIEPPGPAVAGVGPATGRLGRRVLHVPVSGLEVLAAATVAATAGVGRPPEDRAFAGHLTLARAGPTAGGGVLTRLAGVPVDARFAVTELTLVCSHRGPAGARYEVVGRHPLPVAPDGP